MSDPDSDLPTSTEGLSESQFLQRYPFPIVAIGEPDALEETTNFMTLAGLKVNEVGKQMTKRKKTRLSRLEKRGGNPFAMMLTIGRALNNDVHIPSKDVSKFHAYFSRSGESWLITDAGSTNGTFVRGQQLAVRSPTEVKVGEPLIVGSTQLTVLHGHELYEFLRDNPL